MSTPHSTPPGEPRPDPSTRSAPGAADDVARNVPAGAGRSDAAGRLLRADDARGTGTSAPGPVAEDAAEPTTVDAPDGRHHINPARLEVRVRRLALLGLVLVPVVYFIAQSLH